MNFNKIFIAGILLGIMFVWAFSLVSAADDDIHYASEHWSHGSQVYDWKRCGLPIKRNRDDSNVKVRAKRHTHHRHHHKHHRHLGDDSDEVRKVMGGKPVEDGELPWAVSLYENGILRCTGTLVTKRHVLTAAHCFSKDDGVDLTLDNCPEKALDESEVISGWAVGLGSVCRNDLQIEKDNCNTGGNQMEFRLKRAIYRHFFNVRCLKNDFALLELDLDDKKEVPASLANHICLPHLDEFVSQLDWHERAKPFSFGWGKDPLKHAESVDKGTARLQQLDYPNIWPMENCKAHMMENQNRFNEDMLCTMEKANANVCGGDSGGGLISQYKDGQGVRRWFLLGVVSFGSDCEETLKGTSIVGAQVFTNSTFHKATIDNFMGTTELLKFKQQHNQNGGDSVDGGCVYLED